MKIHCRRSLVKELSGFDFLPEPQGSTTVSCLPSFAQMMWSLKFHRPELTETEAEFHRNDARIADLGERRVRNDLPECDIPDLVGYKTEIGYWKCYPRTCSEGIRGALKWTEVHQLNLCTLSMEMFSCALRFWFINSWKRSEVGRSHDLFKWAMLSTLLHMSNDVGQS